MISSGIRDGLQSIGNDRAEDSFVDFDSGPTRWEKTVPVAVEVASVAILLGVWQLITTVGKFSALVLPSPGDLVSTFHMYVGSGQFWTDLRVSGKEFLFGYVIAVVAGILVGLLAGWYEAVRFSIAPYVWFFLSVPIIALTPLIIIWVGIGFESKVCIVALSAFFPMMINTMVGVRELDPHLLQLERSYCAKDHQLFRTLVLPSTIPFILSGMRLAIGHAIVGIYVGELQGGATSGIGFMMSNAGNTGNTPLVFVGLVILGCAGVAFSSLLGVLQKRFQYGSTS